MTDEQLRSNPSEPEPLVTHPSRESILVHDTMGEAGRKALRIQFGRMLAHEHGTRTGEDPDALHDMRVAVRRMRAGFRVFGGYFDDRRVPALRKGLRRTGRVLGAVRDADVFLARAAAYRAALPESLRPDLDGLVAAVETARDGARSEMLDYLDGKKYGRLVASFESFLGAPCESTGYPRSRQPSPIRVRHVVPVLIVTSLANIRAHEEWINGHDDPLERLHRLRISLKRLRYLLEFFQEVLTPVTDELIEELKNEQDHLGALHDAHVAAGIIQRYLTTGSVSAGAGTGPVISSTVTGFLGATHRDGQHYLDHFPDLWERLRSTEFRRAMLGAASELM